MIKKIPFITQNRQTLPPIRTILILLCLFATVYMAIFPSPSYGVRIKDIATFSGVRDNQLVGYGLVIGLAGSGDKKDSPFTTTSMKNMLERMGVAVDQNTIKPKNVAAVLVTANMPVSSKPGSKIDITVSSVGDAKSLQGGVLIQTPLKGADGQTYAIAQGPLIIGGYSSEGASASQRKNTTTVGSIPGGATIERAVPFKFNKQEALTLNMNSGDFSTTMQVVEKLNESMGGSFARALDQGTIRIEIPPAHKNNLVPLIASVENLEITPESVAKVVVDEKTGTIVLGREVRLSHVAVAHGNLQVVISENTQVSQPGPFSSGATVVSPQTDINTEEETRRLNLLEGVSLEDLVEGLNAIGATPRDLISILRALKAAGSLHAQLEVI